MSLICTCPNCGTGFRVVADQLKLRNGMVRCGACLLVFSGLDHLERSDGDSSLAPPQAAVPPFGALPGQVSAEDDSIPTITTSTSSPAASASAASTSAASTESTASTASAASAGSQASSHARPSSPSPVPPAVPLRPAADPDTERLAESFFRPPAWRSHAATGSTSDLRKVATDAARQLHGASADTALEFGRPSAAVPASTDLEQSERAIIDDDELAIDYFATEQRRRGFLGANAGLKLALAALLTGLLVLQAVLGWRDWIGSRFPALSPMVTALAAPFGLPVSAPRAPGAVSIESFEVEPMAASDLLQVSAILRNSADYAVRAPSMMLSLKDGSGSVLVRKAIDPTDYLAADSSPTLRPRSERPVRVLLQLSGETPVGYSVDLFHR